MFGARKRRDAQVIEEIRDQLSAADIRARAVLADAIAQIELRLTKDLEQRERVQAYTEAAIETLQRAVVGSAADVARALGQVSQMCAIVGERIEADRVERRALTEAITLLARHAAPPIEASEAASNRAIGGTVFVSPAIGSDAADEVGVIDAASEVVLDAADELRVADAADEVVVDAAPEVVADVADEVRVVDVATDDDDDEISIIEDDPSERTARTEVFADGTIDPRTVRERLTDVVYRYTARDPRV